jgi:cell division protein ZapA
MSTVTLSIGPKSYNVACADGQEAHIRALGAMIAEKYAQLGSARAPLEAQNVVFAALFLADELAEARKRIAEIPEPAPEPEPDTTEIDAARETIARLEAELAEARELAARPAPEPVPFAPDPELAPIPQFDLFGAPLAASATDAELAARLEALAAAAEASAAALEAAAASA